jgi:hypothetical protein
MCRAVLAIYVGVIALAIVLRSWLPLLYFGLPRYFGGIRSDPGYFIRRPIPGETAGG